MPKVTIDDSKGLVQAAGKGVELKSNVVIHTGAELSRKAKALTASTTLTVGGLYTVSSSTAGAKTLTFPTASTVAGSMFIVRNLSADATILTGSDSGIGSFCGTGAGNHASGSDHGGKLTMSAVTGASVAMMCDGVQYLVTATSGSVTYAGYPDVT